MITTKRAGLDELQRFSRKRQKQAYDPFHLFRDPAMKRAELGGDGHDSDFENAFSSIAHAFLRERAPSLMQYEVGFQLLDRDQDNTKAVGIHGFKVGPLWLYAPVFYLNNGLKGHELLYIKNEDRFVPLKENQLNAILRRRPHVLGKSVDRNPWAHGITAPNLMAFAHGPGKFSSANPDMLPGLAAFSYFATHDPFQEPKYAATGSLSAFLKKEGAAVITALCQTMLQFPKYAESFKKVYGGLDIIKEAVAEAKKKQAASSCHAGVLGEMQKPKKKPTGSVLEAPKTEYAKMSGLSWVTMQSHEDIIAALPAAEKEALLRDSILFHDKRAEERTSIAYELKEPLALTNPTETGVYEVLVKPGTFVRCLVIMQPSTHCASHDFAVVVRLGDDKTYINIHPAHLWIKQQSHTDNSDYKTFFESLSTLEKLPVPDPEEWDSDLHVVLGPRGEGSCVFRVDEAVSDNGAIKTYDVCFRDHARRSRPVNLPKMERVPSSSWDDGSYDERITLTGKVGGRLTRNGNDLFVPAGFKLLTVKSGRSLGDDRSNPPPIIPGNHLDLKAAIFEKTASLKVTNLGSEVQINGESMSPMAGLICLVSRHGLREKAARAIIAQTQKQQFGAFRVKYAAPYPWAPNDLAASGPGSPGFPSQPTWMEPTITGAVPAVGPWEQEAPINMPLNNQQYYDLRVPPDANAIGLAQNAAQTGQKDVFETATIGSLLKQMRDDDMVDANLPDMKNCLDKLGRILFSLYWHGEAFQERYGKQDMPSIEAGLRNTFEGLGDLILELGHKTVEPYPDDVPHNDLSDVARD